MNSNDPAFHAETKALDYCEALTWGHWPCLPPTAAKPSGSTAFGSIGVNRGRYSAIWLCRPIFASASFR